MFHRVFSLITCLWLAVAHASAAAQTRPQQVTRSEARERFERGLRLFNQDNTVGALAEFTRAYELVPHPLVLYNIALVQVAMQRPVDAVSTFDTLLSAPHFLSPEELALARARREEQAALIGELAITVAVPGARVEVDSFEVGQLPLAAAVRVAAGEHTVSVIAQGYKPERRRVLVAGKQRVELALTLTELAGRLAYLTVHVNVQGADVSVDGLVVGKTPLHSSLALGAGSHEIAVARPGYRGVSRTVVFGEGTTGELQLELAVDTPALTHDAGTLELVLSEPDCVVFLDGLLRGAYSEPLRLPPGPHMLRVERADFFSFERQIELPANLHVRVPVVLEPVPAKRALYHDQAAGWRVAGWTTALVGVALVAAGSAFVVYNNAAERDAKKRFDNADLFTEGGDCSPMQTNERCNTEASLRLEHLVDVRAREKFGWIGLGVGAAALITGVIIVLSGDSPDRYESRPQTRVYALVPTGWVGREGGGVAVGGRF
ncbi:MAG: hypothetical protein RL701_3261 [Pseudomonadota bacterium]|jgi:hypothetical protein